MQNLKTFLKDIPDRYSTLKKSCTDKIASSDEKILTLSFVLRVAVIGCALFFLTYFLFSWTMNAVVHNRKEVMMPELTGKSAINALQALSDNNLSAQIEGYEFDESVPIGTVLRQSPDAGITVREGKIARIVLSRGGESVFTPTLTGMPLRNAELLLRQQQLVLGEVSEAYSLRVEKGTVLSQEPKPEISVSKNTMVNVKVSAGAPPAGTIMMPDFRQKRAEEVWQWANKNDIKFDTAEEPSSTFPSGTVIDQKPEVDTILDGNSSVHITVSARKSEASAGGDFRIHYEVLQSGSQHNIRIVAIGKAGERELFNGLRDPGSKIDLMIPRSEASKIRIFVNGILVEERSVK